MIKKDEKVKTYIDGYNKNKNLVDCIISLTEHTKGSVSENDLIDLLSVSHEEIINAIDILSRHDYLCVYTNGVIRVKKKDGKIRDCINSFNKKKDLASTIISLIGFMNGTLSENNLIYQLGVSQEDIAKAVETLSRRNYNPIHANGIISMKRYDKQYLSSVREKTILSMIQSSPSGIHVNEIMALYSIKTTTLHEIIGSLKEQGYPIDWGKRTKILSLNNETTAEEALTSAFSPITGKDIDTFYVLSSLHPSTSIDDKTKIDEELLTGTQLTLNAIGKLTQDFHDPTNGKNNINYVWRLIEDCLDTKDAKSRRIQNHSDNSGFLRIDSCGRMINRFPFTIELCKETLEDFLKTMIVANLNPKTFKSIPNQMKRLMDDMFITNNRYAEDLFKMGFYVSELASHHFDKNILSFDSIGKTGNIKKYNPFIAKVIGYSPDSGKAYLIGLSSPVNETQKNISLSMVPLDSIVWSTMKSQNVPHANSLTEEQKRKLDNITNEMFDISVDSPNEVEVDFNVAGRSDVIEELNGLALSRKNTCKVSYVTSTGKYDQYHDIPSDMSIERM